MTETRLSTERQLVLDLHNQGLTPREIALKLKISTQRAYQQLEKLEVTPNRKAAS